MKAELIVALNAIRKQIDVSSFEKLPLQLMRGFLSVCELLNNHPEELQSQFNKNVLENVLKTVSNLLRVDVETRNTADEYEFVCEICEAEITLYNNDLEFSINIHSRNERHVEMRRKLRETSSYFHAVESTTNSSPRSDDVARNRSFHLETLKTSRKQISHIWCNLNDDFFSEILITRIQLNKPVGFCSGCNEILESKNDEAAHVLQKKHKDNVVSLRETNILSDYYGLTLKWKMQYCVLCSTGLCSSIEIEWHVKNPLSGHRNRLSQLRKKVFSNRKDLLAAFLFATSAKQSGCSLDEPFTALLETRVDSLEMCLNELTIISKDRTRYCCVCDVFLNSVAEGKTLHFANDKHKQMIRELKKSFSAPGGQSGVTLRREYEYCVLCHVGFLNHFESQHHVHHSTQHLSNLNYCRVLVNPKS